MRGNRRTKNTFVAVESRSLTECTVDSFGRLPGWRVQAALTLTRAFSPPRDRPKLAASFSVAPLRCPATDARLRIRERWWGTA